MKKYIAPALREKAMLYEYNLLQTNTEPIGGGNDPDIEW